MNSQWITIKQEQGKQFEGYLSLPPAGKGPGLILIQEIWGVNEHIRAVADQYAISGYVVLAPDVFWRLSPKVDLGYDQQGSQQAFAYYGQVDVPLAAEDIKDAVSTLRELPQVSGKVGVVGYCLGGHLAFRTAAISDVDAAVCYYGGGIDRCIELAEQVSAPIAFHYAEQDAHITAETRNIVKQGFANKSNATFYEYPNCDHGFNCWGRAAMYNQQAAALAQGRTLSFLAQNL